ncbi:uncharacterized protein LOC131233130 isoform X2 [Magnolia sinica]|uniref:uncharacterized protein LOC131233130 isoform X2 n=1 Tax=Magnolia sinica TaxID=86752 RepID=UPI00265971C1|nr:uncharacterized protein LOC131233130 isoform X2 [Magnolia sinica]
MENPFTVKVGQVFTGFGVGCGIGIGVGRPLNLGAIPVLQQVMSATKGATDAFSGVGRHVNNSLRRLGVKGVEAGVGCGVGFGHGFGIGVAIKPGVVHQIQSCLGQAAVKVMTKIGIAPGSVSQSIIPGSLQSSMNMTTGTSDGNVQKTVRNAMQLTTKSTESASYGVRDEGLHEDFKYESFALKGSPSETPLGSRSEKVISSFLQNPALKNGDETEIGELAGQLRSENNALQVVSFS